MNRRAPVSLINSRTLGSRGKIVRATEQIHFPCYGLIHIRSSKGRSRRRGAAGPEIMQKYSLVGHAAALIPRVGRAERPGKRLVDEFGRCTCRALSNGKPCTQHPPIRIQLTLIPSASERRGVGAPACRIKRRSRVGGGKKQGPVGRAAKKAGVEKSAQKRGALVFQTRSL